jgi:hypothetical protein
VQFLSGEEENWPSSLKNFLVEDFLGVCRVLGLMIERRGRRDLNWVFFESFGTNCCCTHV